ncbi:hypothetical protein ABTO47_19500, partial [Acinetobacter baumannii]
MYERMSFASLAALLMAGCATTQPPPPPLATIQTGDSQLTCEELQSQIASMDSVINAPMNSGIGTSLATSAGTTALGLIPVVG